jgi:hypothetical protein
VEIFGQQDILEMVEEALSLLDSPDLGSGLNRDNALPTAMRGFLHRLGLDWVRRSSNEPLMAQFVAARKTFQGRELRSKQIEKLEFDVDWLTGQRDAWIQTAKACEREVAKLSVTTAERESQISAMAAVLAEAREGNDWLLSQKREWERVAAERESQISAMAAVLAEARKGNDWLLSQRDAWEQAATATRLDLWACESVLKALMDKRLFKVLARVRLLELDYTFKTTGLTEGAEGSST